MGFQNHVRAFFPITKTTRREKSEKPPLQHLCPRSRVRNSTFDQTLARGTLGHWIGTSLISKGNQNIKYNNKVAFIVCPRSEMLQGGLSQRGGLKHLEGLFWSTKTTLGAFSRRRRHHENWKNTTFLWKNQYLRRKSTIFKKAFQNFFTKKCFFFQKKFFAKYFFPKKFFFSKNFSKIFENFENFLKIVA